jgi:hypothetical protein
MNQTFDHVAREGNAYALIVGIGDYQDPRIPKLAFTSADAKAFYEVLVDPRRAGFEKVNVRLLLDAEATEKQIKKSVTQWLYNQVSADSTVMIFFAGHGGAEQDKCDPEAVKQAYYFLPWDADPEDLANTCISQHDFERLLHTLRSQRMVVFLDACHSTGVAKPGARDLAITAAPRYDRLAEGEGRVVIAASKPDQRSWEDAKLQHGIFTYHLLEAMRGKADANGDGYVSIQEVASYLQREVPRTVKLLGKEPQDPTFICESLTRDIILTVDAERALEIAKQQSEAELKRIEEMRVRRLKLVELRSRNELPPKEFTEAMLINEKNPDELTATEKDLKDWLDLLLADKITSQLYLKTRAKIQSETGQFAKPKSDIPQIPRAPEKLAQMFCIYCRAKNPAENIFCFSCGKRLH